MSDTSHKHERRKSRKSHRQHQRHREYRPNNQEAEIEGENAIVVLPSTSRVLVDESIQVSSSSLESGDTYNLHSHPHHHQGVIPSLPHVEPLHIHKHQSNRAWKKIPNLINIPPEQIRGAILNHGETYWQTTERSTMILIQFAIVQLIIYLLVFGLSAPHKVLLGLMPSRDVLIAWFLTLNALDLFALVGIIIGKRFSKKFEFTKRGDMYFIMFSTTLLVFDFLGSITFPIFGSFYLVTMVQGTIIMQEGECIEARDKFSNAGTDWSDIATLKEICDEHIVCIKSCRDFRDMFFWIFGTYFMTTVRFFVLISLWNSCSFLCLIMDLHEEHIAYTFSLPKNNV